MLRFVLLWFLQFLSFLSRILALPICAFNLFCMEEHEFFKKFTKICEYKILTLSSDRPCDDIPVAVQVEHLLGRSIGLKNICCCCCCRYYYCCF